ncbi:MAG: cupredoxin family protein [Alphaproteobacteria bacterium]|nr:cupredoxin family protein [Alphaproteobacteria bacterium]MBU0797617.1 cupredoxin family protein [Alphaproteobacteria bacterium]MBU0886595.1 cupredoxin family protein [Alphaproteobacteria bacterium]MBU1812568.1 cupredoxin family protein [Alphaproteobacteria bacterium]MBU2090044.1 cupredoxin family protein [Alphaproteobacteria bacterium]
MRSFRITAFAAALTASALMPLASLQAAPGHSGGQVGEPGKKAEAGRTLTVMLEDNFYEPERITVVAGETVRFVIKNKGEFLHEFNIGTPEMHAAHQKEMAMMAEHGMLTPTGIDKNAMAKMDHSMKHDDPNSVLVEPGKSAEIVWKFTNAGTIEFACNIPGHYEAGMVGTFQFRSNPSKK